MGAQICEKTIKDHIKKSMHKYEGPRGVQKPQGGPAQWPGVPRRGKESTLQWVNRTVKQHT